MRYCKYCGEDKPYDPSAKPHTKASGFHMARCWSCKLVNNAEANRAYRATIEGLAKTSAAVAKIRSTPEGAAQHRASSLAWQKKNPGICNAKSKAYKLARRIPPWANREAIKSIYKEAAEKKLTVDHIVPLRGKFVSGLHVENNLQLLPKSENCKKSNNY